MTQDEMVDLLNRSRQIVSHEACDRFVDWIKSGCFLFESSDTTAYSRAYVMARHKWAMSDPEWCEAMMLTRLGDGR